MLRYAMILVLLVLAAASPVLAVDTLQVSSPDPVLESWRWRSFPELRGLGLQCLAEDRDGKMWFGVGEGAVRYDGTTWTTFTPEDGLLGAPVNVLLATRDGSVYAGTNLGISRFQGGSWQRLFPPEGDLPWRVTDLIETGGGVWAGTERGGLWLGPDGATLHTNAEMAVALGVAAPWLRVSVVPEAGVPTHEALWPEGIGALTVEGVIWALASGGPAEGAGLKIGDRIAALDGQVDGPVGTPVRLTVARSGLVEPFEATVVRDKVSGTIRSFPVYAVYEARDGKMWFGLSSLSGAVGIVRYDVAEKEVRLFTEADGLEIDYRPHIVQTRDGTIWTVFGSARAGVSRYDGRSWTSSRLSAFGGGNINPSVLETRDGTLWVGGQGGTLYAFRDGKWTVYRPPDTPLPGVRIWDLIEASDGALWLVSRGHEAYRLDRGATQWTSYEGLVAQCETPDGAQWFTSQKGEVIRYDGQTWTRYGREDGGLDCGM